MRLSICALIPALTVSGVLVLATPALADRTPESARPTPLPAPMHTGASVGLTIHRFQDNFAIGAVVSSPAFLRHVMRLSLGGGGAWYPYAMGSGGRQDWKTFYHGRLVVEVGPPAAEYLPVRPYGFAGLDALILPDGLSHQPIGVGGIGGFGLEFALRYPERENAEPITFFAELGGVGNAKRAERQPMSPILANGFVATVGFRVYP